MPDTTKAKLLRLQAENPDAIAWLTTARLGGSRGIVFDLPHPALGLFYDVGLISSMPPAGHVVIDETTRLQVLESLVNTPDGLRIQY